MSKSQLFGHLLQQRTRIGNDHKMITRLLPNNLPHTLKKILLKHKGFGRGSRFTCLHTQGGERFDPVFDYPHLRGHRAVQDMQFWIPGNQAKGHPADFRAQLAFLHIQDQNIFKPRFFDFFRQSLQPGYGGRLLLRDPQPPQRIPNILMMNGIGMPDGWIFAPQTADRIGVLKFF